MTQQKDLKRLVRSRMVKTGESYTTARAKLLAKKTSKRSSAPQAAAPQAAAPAAAAAPSAIAYPAPAEFAAIAGMSDDAVKKGTGCRWEKWVKSLDHVRAYEWPHKEIASHIHEKYGTPGWWSQMVAGGYERIRGLRARGQKRDGSYEISKSKTVPVPIAELYRAFASAPARRKWLGDCAITVKKATPEKSMRCLWEDGTPFEINFWPKGAAKSQAALQHSGFPSKAAAERQREFWSERFDALAKSLSKA